MISKLQWKKVKNGSATGQKPKGRKVLCTEVGFTLGGLAVVPPISHPGFRLHNSNSGTKDLGGEGRGRQSSNKNKFLKKFFLKNESDRPVYYSKVAF